MKRSFLKAGMPEGNADQAIALFERMIRCESALKVTKQRWHQFVLAGNGDMEVAERAVYFEIMNRMFDAESDYLGLLHANARKGP